MAKIKGNEFDNELIGATNENNLMAGDPGNDTFYGGIYTDEMYGEAGNDTFISSPGRDIMSGGDGVDTVDYAGSQSGVTVNLLTGNGSGGNAQGDMLSGIENLSGSRYGDTLTGDNGNNELNGHFGSDVLFGGRGDDILSGGQLTQGIADNDTLTGGDGADTFLFFTGASWARDVITDFKVGADVIEFRGDGVVDSMADLVFIQDGNNTVITADGFDFGTITVQGVSVAQLMALQANFLFS